MRISDWSSDVCSSDLLIGHRRLLAPDRTGPGRVAAEAGDDVDVELRHQVAERADVDLVGREARLKGAGGAADLLGELLPCAAVEVMDLLEVRAARHQDEPGIDLVVHQQQARKSTRLNSSH